MKKVLVVIQTTQYVEAECYDSVLAQTYPAVDVIISVKQPTIEDGNPIVHQSKNCTAHRNVARRYALASDADYFLLLDSDIVLPPNAVEEFVTQCERGNPRKHVVGGWYKMINSPRWVCGEYLNAEQQRNFRCPEPSLIRADWIGLGCAFMSREVLERIEFEDGMDLFLKDERGNLLRVDECGTFGAKATELGYQLYMDGNVVCRHLPRERGKERERNAWKLQGAKGE